VRLIGWLIAAAVLSTPVYGIVTSLAGIDGVRQALGLSGSSSLVPRNPEMALSMLPVLLVGAAVWQIVMALRARRRPDLVTVIKRATRASLLLILVGFLATRTLTLIGFDRNALALGPVLGVGVPLLIKLRRAFRPEDREPAVGHIWWADVPFEEVADSKDRPCLIVEVNGDRAMVLMITSKDKTGREGYVPIDGRGWYEGDKSSWLKLDRLINLKSSDFRRYAGPCPAESWALVEQSLVSGVISRPVVAGTAVAAPRYAPPTDQVFPKTAIPFPELPDVLRTATPWDRQRVLVDTPDQTDSQRGERLVLLALDSYKVRGLLERAVSYDPHLVAELRYAAEGGHLQHLWRIAVTETCRAFRSAAPITRDLAAQGAAEYEQYANVCFNLLLDLNWCSSLQAADPAGLGDSPTFAPYRRAAAAAPGALTPVDYIEAYKEAVGVA
jgi:hypothetical protein